MPRGHMGGRHMSNEKLRTLREQLKNCLLIYDLIM